MPIAAAVPMDSTSRPFKHIESAMKTFATRVLPLLLIAASFLVAWPDLLFAQGEPARIALVIGNAQYTGRGFPRLQTPPNDAKLISQTLQKLGFHVVGCQNDAPCLDTDYKAMWNAIQEFSRELHRHPGAIAFFYFSGHGVQTMRAPGGSEENYLIPLDSGVAIGSHVLDKAISVQDLLRAIEAADAQDSIVVLDACRNEASLTASSVSGADAPGLARMQAAGTLIAYSAEPGHAAADSLPGDKEGMPGPYARRLAEQLVVPGQSIVDVFMNVRALIIADTHGEQRPDMVMRLEHNLYLAGPPVVAAQSVLPPGSWIPEKRLALVIGNSGYGGKAASDGGITWPDLKKGPLLDADLMTRRLRELGFQVTELKDQSLDQMNAGIRKFADSITADSLALFYFSGHGAQAPRGLGSGEGEDNYLVPVGTDLTWDYEAYYKALPLRQVSGALKGGRAAVVILDACRNNALQRRRRSPSDRGLIPAENISGMLIAYSTAAGEVAENRAGQPSRYTELLAQTLGRPGELLTSALRAVRKQMQTLSGSDRLPEMTDQLNDDIVLVKP
jgi:uncharacterized caspase-like protein